MAGLDLVLTVIGVNRTDVSVATIDASLALPFVNDLLKASTRTFEVVLPLGLSTGS